MYLFILEWLMKFDLKITDFFEVEVMDVFLIYNLIICN